METDVTAFVDPRTKYNGVRILCVEQSFEPEAGVKIMTDAVQYNMARMVHGLPESSLELGNTFPLNLHLHHLNGVSFDKGCYIGQELTQRTHFTGTIRRIALPFLLLPNNENLTLNVENFAPANHVDLSFTQDTRGEEILDAKGRKLGKVIAAERNTGIAMVDLNRLNTNGPNHEYTLCGNLRTYLWQPLWLDMALRTPEEDAEIQKEEEAFNRELSNDISEPETGLVDPKTGKPPGL